MATHGDPREHPIDGLPPYAYVPGHRPHPTRHPQGHAHGEPPRAPVPLDPDAWRDHPDYQRGLVLFDHGYYWEAHEAWEGPWVAAGRKGAVGELLQGLIALAAAGVKIRQGQRAAVGRLGARARARFEHAQRLHAAPRLAGLAFDELLAFADYVQTEGPHLPASPEPAVEVVFGRRLDPSDRPEPPDQPPDQPSDQPRT